MDFAFGYCNVKHLDGIYSKEIIASTKEIIILPHEIIDHMVWFISLNVNVKDLARAWGQGLPVLSPEPRPQGGYSELSWTGVCRSSLKTHTHL